MFRVAEKVVTTRVRLLTNSFTRALGLMLHTPIHDKAYVFVMSRPQSIPLHMVLVFFPIDVLWLDKNRTIVTVRKRFAPFSLYACNDKPAQYVVELPAGTIEQFGLSVGQKCEW